MLMILTTIQARIINIFQLYRLLDITIIRETLLILIDIKVKFTH